MNLKFKNTDVQIDDSWQSFFEKVASELKSIEQSIGDDYTPSNPIDIFKIFKLPKEQIQFVIVGQDPYPVKGHATGRSFEREIDSWINSKNVSLDSIAHSINFFQTNKIPNLSDIVPELELSPSKWFKHFENNKGVFFMNKSLTTEIGKPNHHAIIWEVFTNKLVIEIAKNESIKWLLWGGEAQKLEVLISNKSSIVKTIHPAAYSYAGSDKNVRFLKFVKESGLNYLLESNVENEGYYFDNEIDIQIAKLKVELANLENKKRKLNYTSELNNWFDPEIEKLKIEIEKLELEIQNLDNQKAELDKILSEFANIHTLELGEIIIEILKLKKLKYKNNPSKYEEANKDEEEYKEKLKDEKDRTICVLNDKEKKELKTLRNKAAFLCHPDRFQDNSEEIKRNVEEISKTLNEAYQNNDLKRVKEILFSLENGEFNIGKAKSINNKEKLISKVDILKAKKQILFDSIQSIKSSEAYKTIISIDDWNVYFNENKELLKAELDLLRTSINS
jgi:uracil DNA glycosylase